MNYLTSFFLMFLVYTCSSQSTIKEDSLFVHRIDIDTSAGDFEKVKQGKFKYNYCEKDSLGNLIALGNIDRKGIAKGTWKFYLGDITHNGKIDYCRGKVKNGKLEGPWSYSWICIRYYEDGKEINPKPCPNI